MRLFLLPIAISLLSPYSFGAPLNAAGMRARQLVHSAANQKFLSELEQGEAEAEVKFWKPEYERILKLLNQGAGSRLEFSRAALKLLEFEFKAKRGAYHVEEAQTLKESWEKEIEWSRTGNSNPSELGTLFMKLRVNRVAIIVELIKDAEEYAKEVGKQYQMLLDSPSSLSERERMKADKEKIDGLVTLAKKQLTLAKTQQREVEDDLK